MIFKCVDCGKELDTGKYVEGEGYENMFGSYKDPHCKECWEMHPHINGIIVRKKDALLEKKRDEK